MDSQQRNEATSASAALRSFRHLYGLKGRISAELDSASIVDLTPEQAIILANLPTSRAFSASESFMFGTNGTYNLRKLRDLKLVAEVDGPGSDRRKTMFRITGAGTAMRVRIEKAVIAALAPETE